MHCTKFMFFKHSYLVMVVINAHLVGGVWYTGEVRDSGDKGGDGHG